MGLRSKARQPRRWPRPMRDSTGERGAGQPSMGPMSRHAHGDRECSKILPTTS